MLKDIRLNVMVFDHVKIRRLREKLGPDGVLCLLQLWCAVAVHKPDGVLKKWGKDDIAYYAGWTKDPVEFVDLLIELHLLDEVKTKKIKKNDEKTFFRLHGWQEHNAWVAKQKERSIIATKNANARWDKKKSPCNSHTDGNANGMQTACNPHTDGNAPSPSPSPSPLKEKEEEREDNIYPPPLKEVTLQFLNYVYLTQAEYDKLLVYSYREKVLGDLLPVYIERLNDYLEQIGPQAAKKKYRSHAAAIRTWFRRDIDEGKAPGLPSKDEERARKHIEDRRRKLNEPH